MIMGVVKRQIQMCKPKMYPFFRLSINPTRGGADFCGYPPETCSSSTSLYFKIVDDILGSPPSLVITKFGPADFQNSSVLRVFTPQVPLISQCIEIVRVCLYVCSILFFTP